MNKYIETENSDEFIIGLEAFNISIDKYEESRGNFLSFASVVIKNKVIDYMRKEKTNNNLSINALDECNMTGLNSQYELDKFNETISAQTELMDFKNILLEYDITLNELVQNSPKHKDTRINAIHIACYIQKNKELKDELYNKKRLPYAQIISQCKSSRKFLDRNRKFIIATVLILDSNLDILKDYVFNAERRSSYDI